MNHLKILITMYTLLMISGCGSSGLSSQSVVDEPILKTEVEDPINPMTHDSSRWVIEGKIRVSVTSMENALNELRIQLKDRGDVTRQDLRVQQDFPRANLTLRIKPGALPKLLSWLRQAGQVDYEEISREEVSQRLLAQEISIKNAQTTLERLKVFIDKDSLKVSEVLRVESEMRRLREMIDKSEGERNLLKGRISFATLHVTLSERPKRLPRVPKAQFYISARPNFITTNPSAPEKGWGLSLFNPKEPAAFHVDFDYFEASQKTMLTIGSASYSEFFGDGQNNYLNPHVGFKIGYGHEQGHHLVFGAALGLELVRFKYAFMNLKAEGLGWIGQGDLDWMTMVGIDFAVVY